MRPEEGISHIALGLGKTVVEGGKSLWFSPARPKKLVQFATVENMLQYSQREFYALDMTPGRCLRRDTSNLVLRTVQDAENELPVTMLASTYIAEEERVRDACLPGVKIMTFAQLLKYPGYPLAQVLAKLLQAGKACMGGEVEIEFALHLEPEIEKSVFYFLQIRLMVTGGEMADVHIGADEREKAFCSIKQCLGHGSFSNMADIIYVCPDTFDASKTREIALEIGAMNRRLQHEKRPFLLIGPGRWGSADPWLGIPVQWTDISGVAAIIEVRSEKIRAEPSQGTHFFQNITSLAIPYLTLHENGRNEGQKEADFLDWQWLARQTVVKKGQYIRHVRLSSPFVLKCDGIKAESVLFEMEKQCKMVCTIQGKEGG
jgi:hypothetical protein